ncbi:tapetum determinant 1 [Rhynchospora pubera]|uniref:Tapetum determinant 1 n=1 Tax=Rhynchospora pubera TaxID=906938 RepID=A0AAV8C8Z2_9POAL|nr:tapetum determinant 1 [Rhynchospora pubera]
MFVPTQVSQLPLCLSSLLSKQAMAYRGTIILFFLVSLFLANSNQVLGTQPCRPSDIVITQSRTNKVVEGKPEYAVSIRNVCKCAQSKVFVQCYGLSSVESVDSRAIRAVDGERCMLGGGRPISKGTPLKFKYAWMTPQDFPVISSTIHC